MGHGVSEVSIQFQNVFPLTCWLDVSEV